MVSRDFVHGKNALFEIKSFSWYQELQQQQQKQQNISNILGY